MRALHIIPILLLCSIGILPAQNVIFKAETDATSLVENGIFEVSFVLENADGNSFTPPDFSPFKVVAGPSRSMSTTIINGVMSKSSSFTYTLQAGRPGKYTIPPAIMQVKGQTLRSNALLIEVVRGQQGNAREGEIELPKGTDVFLAAEPDTHVLYPGQQVQLNYTLYSTLNVRNFSTLAEDDYSKYYMRQVKDFNYRQKRVAINGIQYQSQILKSIALFPQQLGRDTIDPFIARLGIGVNDPNSGFFFSLRTVPKNVQSDPVVLEVKPLPPDAPSSFNGAVGQYLMHAQIDKYRMSTDDALVLTLQIQGNGDARRWEAPTLDELRKDFEIYPPKTILDRSIDQSGTIINEKRFEYLLVPRKAVNLSFSVPFTYFEPLDGEYRTLSSDTFNLIVTRGTGKGDISEMLALQKEDEVSQLRGLKQIDSLGKSVQPFFLSVPYFLLLITPLMGYFFLFLMKSRKEEFEGMSGKEKRRRLASKKAKSLLKAAKSHLDSGNARAFYEAVSFAIIGYLAGKMGIPNSALSRENIRMKMKEKGFSEEVRSRVMQLIEEGNIAMYAGGTEAGNLQEHYDKATKLFIDLESGFRE